MAEEQKSDETYETLLSKLTVMDLMELAKERKLDASKCRSKADYIKLLSRKEKVPDAPKEERLPEKELKELEMIKKELAETGEEIKKTIEEAKSIPNMVDEEADALISHRKNLDVNFDDIEDMLEHIRMRFEDMNYSETLIQSMNLKKMTNMKITELENYLWAYTILSTQKIIENCGRAGGDVYHASSLLLSAKDTFKKGGLSDNRALLDDLQKEAKGLLEKEVAKAKKHLLEVQGYVVDVKNLGANVADAEGEIKLAFEFIERDDHLKCTEHANMAREVAEDSRERRIGEIEIAIPETQILVEEAKDLGSDVKEAGKLLEQAKVALKKKDYLLTNELTKRAQQKTAEVQNTQIQKAMELRQRQMENISKSISKVEPLIKEAEVYGLDVVDVSDMLQRAKLALEYQDYVNGTFYIKNAGELVKKLEPELHKFRKGSEVRRPKGDICTRCKSTNLKFFANGWGKCISCGNIFKWKATARTEKKKKGLFNRLFKGDQDS